MEEYLNFRVYLLSYGIFSGTISIQNGCMAVYLDSKLVN